jgi:hypothetical protein
VSYWEKNLCFGNSLLMTSLETEFECGEEMFILELYWCLRFSSNVSGSLNKFKVNVGFGAFMVFWLLKRDFGMKVEFGGIEAVGGLRL